MSQIRRVPVLKSQTSNKYFGDVMCGRMSTLVRQVMQYYFWLIYMHSMTSHLGATRRLNQSPELLRPENVYMGATL